MQGSQGGLPVFATVFNGQTYYMAPTSQTGDAAHASGNGAQPHAAFQAPAVVTPSFGGQGGAGAGVPAMVPIGQLPQGQKTGLVADLCKIIERQSQEIATLVVNSGGTPNQITLPPDVSADSPAVPLMAAMGVTTAVAQKSEDEVEYTVEAAVRHPAPVLAGIRLGSLGSPIIIPTLQHPAHFSCFCRLATPSTRATTARWTTRSRASKTPPSRALSAPRPRNPQATAATPSSTRAAWRCLPLIFFPGCHGCPPVTHVWAGLAGTDCRR